MVTGQEQAFNVINSGPVVVAESSGEMAVPTCKNTPPTHPVPLLSFEGGQGKVQGCGAVIRAIGNNTTRTFHVRTHSKHEY